MSSWTRCSFPSSPSRHCSRAFWPAGPPAVREPRRVCTRRSPTCAPRSPPRTPRGRGCRRNSITSSCCIGSWRPRRAPTSRRATIASAESRRFSAPSRRCTRLCRPCRARSMSWNGTGTTSSALSPSSCDGRTNPTSSCERPRRRSRAHCVRGAPAASGERRSCDASSRQPGSRDTSTSTCRHPCTPMPAPADPIWSCACPARRRSPSTRRSPWMPTSRRARFRSPPPETTLRAARASSAST